jgi:hypothetical protein
VALNRLEGVTTTCFYQDDSQNQVEFNAMEYNQVNPQITDSEGRYQWFVPSGLWKVTYAKEGYEPAESEWMEVPPPRIDVNEALISLRSAAVIDTILTPNYAEVEFDKYLDVDTVTDLIHVSGLSGNIEAMNGETSGMGDNRTLASRFRYIFDGVQAEVGKTYQININSTAKCYAGVENTEYQDECICLPIVDCVEAELPDYMLSNQELVIPVKVTSAGGYDQLTLSATSDREDLTKIVGISEIDPNGNASITVQTAKAGATELHLSVNGSLYEASRTIIVARSTDNNLIQSVMPATAKSVFPFLWWQVAALAGGILIISGIILLLLRKRKDRIG